MCYPVCGMMHKKEPLLLVHVAAVGFLSRYLSGALPYVYLVKQFYGNKQNITFVPKL